MLRLPFIKIYFFNILLHNLILLSKNECIDIMRTNNCRCFLKNFKGHMLKFYFSRENAHVL